jgi:hypothetical protein
VREGKCFSEGTWVTSQTENLTPPEIQALLGQEFMLFEKPLKKEGKNLNAQKAHLLLLFLGCCLPQAFSIANQTHFFLLDPSTHLHHVILLLSNLQ